jgi:RNA polymerase sigma factor (sigma-70 family)
MEDRELLRQFLYDRNEQAFAELVKRHINLVYSAARRQMNDSAGAEDVTQSVFVLLASKARKIQNAQALAGWLLVATRGIALNAQRAEARRRHYESEAAAMKHEALNQAGPAWEQIKPLLDDAVSRLRSVDRDALTLRFFENRELPQVAEALGISQLAAQKRISRAVGRLRELFARQGVRTSSEALSSLLIAHSVLPAPAALSSKVTASAVSGMSIPTLKGAAAIMAMTMQAKIAFSAAAAVLLIGIIAPVVHFSAVAQMTAASPATQPTTAPVENWRARFNRAYALKDGEMTKRVQPPFISERLEYFNSTMMGFFTPAGSTTRPAKPPRISALDVPTSFVLSWDGFELKFQSSGSNAPRSLASALLDVAGIWPQETDIPRDVLANDVLGDWVIRTGATTEQKLAAVCEAAIGPGNVFKLEPMEREALIVTGKLDYRPYSNARKLDVPNQMRQLFLYRNSERVQPSAVSVAQTQSEFLMKLGQMLDRPVVVEAELGDPRPVVPFLGNAHGMSLTAKPLSDPAEKEMLDLVTEQTGLKFERAFRILPTWRLYKAEK